MTTEQSHILACIDSTLTIESLLTGREFTYRIRSLPSGLHAVDVIEGADNESELHHLGHIAGSVYSYHPNSPIAPDANAAIAFLFYWGCPSHPQLRASAWSNVHAG